MISVVTWKWGTLFSARHVNALRAGLERHLHLDHRLICVTDDPAGIDGDVEILPMPTLHAGTPRCRRRMEQWDRAFGGVFGARMLSIDLDVVIVDDITPIVDRPEPICCWRVAHAGVYSGSFVLADVGALHGAWEEFSHDPDGYPVKAQARGISSDQAMLNYFLQGKPVATWTERDGFVSYYGRGYERLEHFGIGPTRKQLPAGARIVVLGSADLAVLEDPSYPWVRDHYLPLVPA